MNIKKFVSKWLVCLTLLISMLSFTVAVDAATEDAPKPGNYCPDANILLVTAEELSSSLDLAMRSRAAYMLKDRAEAVRELFAARTVLRLAASRGAAARTGQLIDAVIQSWSSENFAQLLTWFPVLRASMLSLPEESAVRAAEESIGLAEEIMQGFKSGNAMQSLQVARHLLACDGLDIPMQEAMRAQDELMRDLSANAKDIDYTALRDSLRNALLFTLSNGET